MGGGELSGLDPLLPGLDPCSPCLCVDELRANQVVREGSARCRLRKDGKFLWGGGQSEREREVAADFWLPADTTNSNTAGQELAIKVLHLLIRLYAVPGGFA